MKPVETRSMPSKTEPASKRLLKVREAAHYTGLSTKRIRAAVHSGVLPYIQFEEFGSWWVDVRDLDKWIEATKQQK